MRRWITILLSIFFISTSLVISNEFTYTVAGATYYVGSDQAYTTIQSAINASSSGDTIYVHAGQYNETININKPLTIIGNGTSHTTLHIGNSGTGIRISADGCHIKGFNITTGSNLNLESQIATNSNNNTIEDIYGHNNFRRGITIA